MESHAVGLIQISSRGVVTRANDAFLTMLGLDRTALPLALQRVTPSEWQAWDQASLAGLMLSKQTCWYHKELVDSSGRLIPVLVILSIAFRSRQGFIATVVDLSAPIGRTTPPDSRALLQLALDAAGNIHSIDPGYAVDVGGGNRDDTAGAILECHDRIQVLTTELSEVREQERERFSIGLHDEVAQPLAVARFKLGALKTSLARADGERIASILASVDQAIQATRSLTLELNTRTLADSGLTVALRRLGERLMAEADIAFHFHCDTVPAQPPQEISLILFRVTRELLRNVVKHSGASQAKLAVAAENDSIRIVVEDDGQGFTSTSGQPGLGRPGAFGLFSIHEQVNHFGGRLEIFNLADHGARVVLTMPAVATA